MKHKIFFVEKESICDALGVKAGDFLVRINGKEVVDCFDYLFYTKDEHLLVEIETAEGELWELDIEKADECLGLVFLEPLMSPLKHCVNKCIFCFVDQEPPGLRKSLYVKDDDYRHSFLHGNFITLSNMGIEDANRIAALRLSPLRVSVHAANLDVRKKIMGSERAKNLFDMLEVFQKAKISLHFQIVLCKGINDGVLLDETIEKLSRYKYAESLAIVPAGLTRHRNGLVPLHDFTPQDARQVISQVSKTAKGLGKKRSTNFVFCSDEWYIKAGQNLPKYGVYGDFVQLSNGVGMVRLFEYEFQCGLSKLPKSSKKGSITIVTGSLAYQFMVELMSVFCKKFRGADVSVCQVKNQFYGETVTVSGLLTGEDIMAQVKTSGGTVFIPENAFRKEPCEMLDGTTLEQLERKLGRQVKVGSNDGGIFAIQLYRELVC